MSTFDGNIEHLTGQYIGSTAASADDGSTCTVNAGVRSLCTAKSKLHDAIALGCIAYAGCFCSDQRLMVYDVQDRGFHKLGFHDRSNNFDKWLTWEHDASLRNGIDASGEPESA